MAINGTKVIDLDSHLVGDVGNWKHCIEEDRGGISSPGRFRPNPTNGARPWWARASWWARRSRGRAARSPNGTRRKTSWPGAGSETSDKDGIDLAVLSPNSPALDLVWFPEDPELAAAYCRAQNNYMQQYAGEFPERLQWAGVVPLQDRDPGGQGTAPHGGYGQHGPQHESGAGGGPPVVGPLLRPHLRRVGEPALAHYHPRHQAPSPWARSGSPTTSSSPTWSGVSSSPWCA